MDVTSVIAAGDGKCIYSASYDTQIKKWNLESKQCLWSVEKAHKRYVLSLALAMGGRTLVSSSFDCEVTLWKLSEEDSSKAPERYKTLAGEHKHNRRVSCVDISNDGKTVISAAYDHTIKVWNGDGIHQYTLKGHTDKVLSAILHGDRIYSASWDHQIRCWHPVKMSEEKIKELQEEEKDMPCPQVKNELQDVKLKLKEANIKIENLTKEVNQYKEEANKFRLEAEQWKQKFEQLNEQNQDKPTSTHE